MAIIENQLVKVKWHYSNEEWFMGKGYMKTNSHLEVPLEDLMSGSKLLVKVNCDCCHKDFEQRYNVVNKSTNHFCNRECLNSYRKLNGSPNNTKVKVNCFCCNKEIKVQKYRYDKLLNGEVSFIACSRICQNRIIGQNNKGENNSQYKEKIKMNCDVCEQEFEIEPHRVGRAKYCSVACQRIGVGKQNIPTKKRLVNCYNCDKEFSRWEHELNRYEHHFCSAKCRVACQGIFIAKQKGNYDTGCQITTNDLLKGIGINYTNEKPFGSYSVDNYLEEYDLIIEVMGDYWHSNPTTYKCYENLNKTQKQRIKADKSKKTYFKKHCGIDILYLWEKDLNDNPETCKELIKNYVNSKGVLEDYNSFNYKLVNGKLASKKNIILPYFKKANTKRQKA